MDIEPNNNNNTQNTQKKKKNKKRQQEEENQPSHGKNRLNRSAKAENGDDEASFQDPFEDEYEQEEATYADQADDNDDEEEMELEGMQEADWERIRNLEMGDDEEEGDNVEVWQPKSGGELAPGETLDYESSAYEMLHRMTVEWPCLSFDVVIDKLGYQRTRFPMTAYIVTATQAFKNDDNKLLAIKMSQLHRTKYDDRESSDEEDDEDEDEDEIGNNNNSKKSEKHDHLDDNAEMEFKSISHPSAVNRIRALKGADPSSGHHIVSTWGSDGVVYIWDVSSLTRSLDGPTNISGSSSALISKLTRHNDEGFAMDWSPVTVGRLLTGDCKNQIYLSEMHENQSWIQNEQPFIGHKKSVEDLQWSPNEADVFASCSVDRTVKVWDVRMKHSPALSYVAADTDVNVISWNHKVPYLMLSGADDGSFHIWDLRSLKPNQNTCASIGHFKWHTQAITSVEWDPNDESVLAVAGEDNQITVWDLSLERDTEASGSSGNQQDEFPPQLLFCHQGQTEIKELHWHPQLTGVLVSTAADGFNIWKPAIDIEQEDPEDIRI